MGQKTFAIVVVSVVAVSIVAAGVWTITRDRSGDVFANCRDGVVAGGAGAIGGPFTLTDQTGQTVTDADVFSRPALVYFGYTFCPDVCPIDVTRNAEAIDILQDKGFDIRPVFITIDPDRDTPEALLEYASYMHPDLLSLTGTHAQIKAASLAYKTYYKKQETGDEFYLMDHSTFSYLVLPETGFANFFRREETPEHVAETAACFLQKLG